MNQNHRHSRGPYSAWNKVLSAPSNTLLLLQYRPDLPNVAPSSKFINIVASCILQTIRLRFNPLEKMRDKWKNWNDKRNIVLFGMR